MTAAEEVTQVPCGLRRMTFRLTSSQAGAMPDSLPTRARGTYPLSPASFESATSGTEPSGEQPAMIPPTWVPCPLSSDRPEPGAAGAGLSGLTR